MTFKFCWTWNNQVWKAFNFFLKTLLFVTIKGYLKYVRLEIVKFGKLPKKFQSICCCDHLWHSTMLELKQFNSRFVCWKRLCICVERGLCDVCLCRHNKWEQWVPCGDTSMKVSLRCREWNGVFSSTCKSEKKEKTTMGSSTMKSFETTVTSYHQHFSKYLKEKKQVMQFILNLVWKMVFANYKATFPIELFMKILWNVNFGTHWKSWKLGHPMRKGIWEGGVAKWKELGIVESNSLHRWTCHSEYFQKVTKCDWWHIYPTHST